MLRCNAVDLSTITRDFVAISMSFRYIDAMSKEELEKFLAAMKKLRSANTASPEAARSFLEREGYLKSDGSVAEPYKSARE